MRGVLLRSGRSEDFTALGETGQPVYRAALQIREAIRRKYPDQPHLVEHLAIPQPDELGSTLDWYSERPGDVIPWTSATEEERAPARAQLEILQARINDLSNTLLGLDANGQPLASARNIAQGDSTVFGKLLTCTVPFPDENFVYLVDGRPVLTFWGFIHAGAERSRQPLHCLYPKVVKTPEPVIAPPPVTPVAAPVPPPLQPIAPVPVAPWWRRWGWWWLLLLPLLLLLLWLLLGMRGCVPALQLPGVHLPGMNLPTAEKPAIDLSTNGQGVDLGGASGGLLPGGSGSGLDLNAPGTGGTGSPQPAPGETAAEAPPAPAPEQQPEAELKQPEAEQPAPPEPAPAPPEVPADQQAGEQKPAGPANLLSIPENAANGAADFLNGNWNGAGIQEVGTGNPLRLKYDFKDGKGQAVVSRSDGVRCQAPVAASMNQGQLSIDSNGAAACADGSSYDLPQVKCKPGATSAADCSANYGADSFDMFMKKAGQ